MEDNCQINRDKTAQVRDLIDTLRQNQLKLTGARLTILKALTSQQKPITIKELHQMVGKDECDLATIYRLFNCLEKLRVIQRVDFGDGVARYELITAEHPHHHHIICINCSAIVKIDECFVEQFQNAVANQSGFKSISHKLEFFGICPKCQ